MECSTLKTAVEVLTLYLSMRFLRAAAIALTQTVDVSFTRRAPIVLSTFFRKISLLTKFRGKVTQTEMINLMADPRPASFSYSS